MAPSALPAPDHGVQLVDEQDDLAFLLREIVEHALEALLELAAELGAGDQRAHVEREDALALEPSGTSPLMMRWARPSTMAVLPTPGSPMSTGLFLCGARAPAPCGGSRRRGRSPGRACRSTHAP
jgi:hypothetical protein